MLLGNARTKPSPDRRQTEARSRRVSLGNAEISDQVHAYDLSGVRDWVAPDLTDATNRVLIVDGDPLLGDPLLVLD